ETIFTLMMNYIAIKFVTYLQYGPWMDPAAGGFPRIRRFGENALMPEVLGVQAGWIIALICVALVFFFMNYTKKGYEIAVVGESVETARYAGMNIDRIIIVAMLISGGLCGLVGMIQASAIEKTLVSSISCGYGFTAIITAWLSRLNAVAVLFVCVAFAMLIQGGAYIQIALSVPSSVSDVVQGLILFFVLGSEFFIQYKVTLNRRANGAAAKEVA
ncbi:MAG: ABC transporter permease, partial [Bacillota bacterium]|nr:ABC transporter permease [Bacillota bacterium]